MSRRNDYLVRVAAVALGASLAAGLLSGCGKRGPLEQPAPLFGDRAKAEYQASHAAATKDEPGQTKVTRDDDNSPPTTRDIRDPAQVLTPAGAAPIPGAPDVLGPPLSAKSPY